MTSSTSQLLLNNPQIVTKKLSGNVRGSYNQTCFKHRLGMLSARLARARRLGQNPLAVLAANPHYFSQLLPEQPLDGLALYRLSAAKLTIPKQIIQAQTRTIMVISHC